MGWIFPEEDLSHCSLLFNMGTCSLLSHQSVALEDAISVALKTVIKRKDVPSICASGLSLGLRLRGSLLSS